MSYKLDFNETTKTMHITFHPGSTANCYREKEDKYTWIINVGNNRVEGLKITPFRHLDYAKLQDNLHRRTSMTDENIRSLIYDLRKFKSMAET